MRTHPPFSAQPSTFHENYSAYPSTFQCVPIHLSVRTHPPFILRRQKTTPILMKLLIKNLAQCLQNKLK
ncbi:hypothetical protein CHV77_21950 [Salmonella enterica subsp. enterica serovar Dublin]|nr:hypothetical protein [Salmonella enterica]EDG7991225.1 hypothetical protein [Salmonella enterica subsp. enterica serovar Dublin]EDK2861877.1 hypothetical protein [Salmonella enterica subsp. enterica serovar Dublin]EDK2881116.1 hypothetical protein [Salmonella enterica subsp. enterica serovar Dublin]TKX09998.1 hypothetical protein FD854_22925 [Salmonella enterica subsp. enterica serovar Dublin]